MKSRRKGDVGDGEGVRWFDWRMKGRVNVVGRFEGFRGEDVRGLRVFVEKEGDVGGRVGMVVKRLKKWGDRVFVGFEVKNRVRVVVGRRDMRSGDRGIVVRRRGFGVFLEEGRKRFGVVEVRVKEFK